MFLGLFTPRVKLSQIMQSVSAEIGRKLKSGELQLQYFRSRCFRKWMELYKFDSYCVDVLSKVSTHVKDGVFMVSKKLPGFLQEVCDIYWKWSPQPDENTLRVDRNGVLDVIAKFQMAFNTFKLFEVKICTEIDLWHRITHGEDIFCSLSSLRSLPAKTQISLSQAIGIPVVCFEDFHRSPFGINGRIQGKYTLLIPAYERIAELYLYDVVKQRKLVDLVNDVYEKSIASFGHTYLKIDYDLVVLSNYREFQRIQETSSVYSKSLYWFDNADVQSEGTKDLMDLLAIERSWARDPTSNVRYLVTCGFPAGTMFLRTTVEAQATTRGGGIEYLHLDTSLGFTFIGSVKIDIGQVVHPASG